MRRFLIFFIVLIVPEILGWGLLAQSTGTRGGAATKPAQSSTAKPAQTPTAKPAAAEAALTPASLKTDSLNYGDDVKRIYVGDFEHVRLKPDGPEIGLLVGGYMKTFSEQCDQYLPKNKVEIMTTECAQEAWSVNGYGVEIAGSRHCSSYRTVGTGRYADPEVYALQSRQDAAMAKDMLGDMMAGMKEGGDLAGGMKKTTDLMVYAASDMDKLISENGCAKPSTVRFQANMLRFGEGKEPIRMPGGVNAVAAPAVATTGPFKDQNYKRLIDDLIAEESRAWMMNQYQKGSVTNDQVKRDAQGRPSEVDANYGYLGMGRPYKGAVRVTFRDGAPECLYFSDFPTTCRAPNPRVISAYEKQGYAQ